MKAFHVHLHSFSKRNGYRQPPKTLFRDYFFGAIPDNDGMVFAARFLAQLGNAPDIFVDNPA
jgi:hypothetical protein